MRRWELVGDGSAKFWEAEAEGASVRVRHGRVGGSGRLQVRELADAAAAAAHLAKLIGQKERAGYREAGGAAGLSAQGPFVLPARWRALVLPRRGGGVPAEPSWPGPADAAAGDALVAARGASIAETLDSEGNDPGLLRAARAHLDGAADPLGAACVALLLPWARYPEPDGGRQVVDAWTARQGLAFAALAALESFEATHENRASWRSGELVRREDSRLFDRDEMPLQYELLVRARQLIAAAEDGEYRAARAALAGARSTPRRRVLAGVLMPEVGEWVLEAIAGQPDFGPEAPLLRTLLLLALGTREQVELLGHRPKLLWDAWSPERIATLADGLGADCVPLLAGALPGLADGAARRELAECLLEFPDPEALDALIGHSQDPHLAPVLSEAVRRRPVGALRRLAVAAGRGGGPVAVTARHLLDAQLAELRPLLADQAARIDPADTGFLAALERERPRVPDAAPQALPAPLVAAPWEAARKARAAAVLDGLDADRETLLRWREGEREEWAAACPQETSARFGPDTDWAAAARGVLGEGPRNLWTEWDLLMTGPAEVLAPFVPGWRPGQFYLGEKLLHPLLAKYGVATVPAALHCVRERPALMAPALLPVLDAEAARLLAPGLSSTGPLLEAARAWFARHGVAGALLLVPEALGRRGPARTAAEQALRLVAAEQGR
ncbi:WGR domain-containing protein, partial [Kitasatospora sp. NPDC057198]|uniref:WGR domain-containing protein n=1 Tax=Kitasatospora sp. NPDC057198 TaxID=3346046 RepID=UPI003633027E